MMGCLPYLQSYAAEWVDAKHRMNEVLIQTADDHQLISWNRHTGDCNRHSMKCPKVQHPRMPVGAIPFFATSAKHRFRGWGGINVLPPFPNSSPATLLIAPLNKNREIIDRVLKLSRSTHEASEKQHIYRKTYTEHFKFP